MDTTGIYFAFYRAPLASTPGMPVLTDAFDPGNGGLGIRSLRTGLSTTALTSFNGFTSTVTAVPEPASAWLLQVGALALAARRMRHTQENGA